MRVVAHDGVKGARDEAAREAGVDQVRVGRGAKPEGDVQREVHAREFPVAPEVLERVVADAALHERGEKLNELGNKVQDLANDAEDFASMAKKLRQQSEKQSRWLPF